MIVVIGFLLLKMEQHESAAVRIKLCFTTPAFNNKGKVQRKTGSGQRTVWLQVAAVIRWMDATQDDWNLEFTQQI